MPEKSRRHAGCELRLSLGRARAVAGKWQAQLNVGRARTCHTSSLSTSSSRSSKARCARDRRQRAAARPRFERRPDHVHDAAQRQPGQGSGTSSTDASTGDTIEGTVRIGEGPSSARERTGRRKLTARGELERAADDWRRAEMAAAQRGSTEADALAVRRGRDHRRHRHRRRHLQRAFDRRGQRFDGSDAVHRFVGSGRRHLARRRALLRGARHRLPQRGRRIPFPAARLWRPRSRFCSRGRA